MYKTWLVIPSSRLHKSVGDISFRYVCVALGNLNLNLKKHSVILLIVTDYYMLTLTGCFL